MTIAKGRTLLLLGLLLCALPAAAKPAKSEEAGDAELVASIPKPKRRPHTLFAWGRNNAGQLGLGHTADVDTPQMVSTFAAKEMKKVAAGGANEDIEKEGFSLVVSSAGNLFTFGFNKYGQLGVGDKISRSSLVPVTFAHRGRITQVSAGATFSVAVTEGGEVYTWGFNGNGELGLGDLKDRLVPELITGQLANVEVTMVSAGAAHVLAMTSEGELLVWGSNTQGQLGIGKQVVRQSTPVKIQGAITGIKFTWVSAGGAHTLAASKSGEVYCWGSNEWGQLGLGDLEERATPHAILHRFTRSKINRVAAGGKHSVALTEGGDIYTWGSNECGQLGYETKGGHKYVGYPKRVETIRASRIKASYSATLAVLPSAKVFIWGCSHNGELGLGDATTRQTPHMIGSPGGVPFSEIALGANHVLGVNKKGELYGWGKNTIGQLGLAYHTRAEYKPVLISSVGTTDVTAVTTGGYAYEYQGHTLAQTAGGKMYAWGWNAFGQLGAGTLDSGSSTPTRLFALESPYTVKTMAAGQYNNIVATDRKGTPHLYTWGPNYNGQLGHKFMELGPVLTPSKVDVMKGVKVEQVCAGYAHMLLLTGKGEVFAWGNNLHGQLGTGDSKERTKPTPIHAFQQQEVRLVACGQQSSYAVAEDGAVFAWGYNDNFELGLGEGINRNSPQPIKALQGTNITAIAPGGYHVLAADEGGALYAWGANQYGQLGLGHLYTAKTPQLVQNIPPVAKAGGGTSGQDVIASGSWHSCAVTQEGRLYTWGRGHYGQLGHPHADLTTAANPTPKLVDALADSAVNKVVAGAAHTLVTAVPGASWGL